MDYIIIYESSVCLRWKMIYIKLGDRWCGITVMNVYAPTEDTCEDTKDSFYEKTERASCQIPKYQMDILTRDFNIQVGRKYI
jgi:hypothetical protein